MKPASRDALPTAIDTARTMRRRITRPPRTLGFRGASKILAQHRIEVELAKDLPMVEIDPVLFEQVLFNLLDNAAKYAPTGTTIRIQSWREQDSIGLQVLDEGDGIPPGDLEHIFDKFYRARKVDRVRAGTGLGLAISRGLPLGKSVGLYSASAMQS
jgi:K+-sensing histidine kinase KdpD